MQIGIVTDEISTDVGEALDYCAEWGIRLLELREGGTGRFPNFTTDEVRLVDEALAAGATVTAVSPGIFKGNIGDESVVETELGTTLPRAIEWAARWECPRVIVFGFDKAEGSQPGDRMRVQRAFERAAEVASAAGVTVIVENEPNFWIDHAETSGSLLREVGHPGLRLNWDPGNLAWGGREVSWDEFNEVRDLIANVHVKDFTPDDVEAPWRPVGDGIMAWGEILGWVSEIEAIRHVTLETHCADRIASSKKSVKALRELLKNIHRDDR
jgi:sugar phosphate isomerase/epimerase